MQLPTHSYCLSLHINPQQMTNFYHANPHSTLFCTCCMSTMDTESPLMSSKPNLVADHDPLKTSKTTKSIDDFQDFECYDQRMTPSPPKVGYFHDAKLIESSSSVDFRKLIKNAVQQDALMKQESGREKLEKHWTEVAGRVYIPENWGQENYLKDWTDNSLFDSLLAPKGVVSAREALVAERRRENSRCLTMTDQNGEQVLRFLT